MGGDSGIIDIVKTAVKSQSPTSLQKTRNPWDFNTFSIDPQFKERVDYLFAKVYKSLEIPFDVATWLAAIELKTERQRAEMAVWLYENKETDVTKLLAKAKEIAAQFPGQSLTGSN